MSLKNVRDPIWTSGEAGTRAGRGTGTRAGRGTEREAGREREAGQVRFC